MGRWLRHRPDRAGLTAGAVRQECTRIGGNGLSAPFWGICVHCCDAIRRGVHKCPTLQPATHVKTHSGGLALTERRSLRRRRHRDVTERRTLGGRRHGKAHSACGRWLCREAIFADLCTLLHTHGRSRDRAGPWVPRHRGARGPRDARAPGPEVHATGAVTQPPTRTHEASNMWEFCFGSSRGG